MISTFDKNNALYIWQYRILLSILWLFFFNTSGAQTDSLIQELDADPVNADLIEDFILATDGNEDFDFNALFEELAYLRERPLNLNEASAEDLKTLQLLSDRQINDLISYRTKLGDLLVVHELQAIPSFDLNTINRILPFVGVDGGIDDYNLPIFKMMASGKNELFIRWRRTLEKSRGFKPFFDSITLPVSNTPFLGDPNKVYMRFKHSYENRLSYGFTAEKDEGEEFFSGNNSEGFDFYSAHFHLKNYNKLLKDITLGDFNASFGQGLILFSGFGSGKGAEVMNIKRTDRAIRPYRSVDENNFMRGAGITLNLQDKVEVTTFASLQRRDANLLEPDTSDLDDDAELFTSLQTSGLHRTIPEILDKNALQQFTAGGSVKYLGGNWHVALNGLYNKLDKDLERRIQPYNRFFFSGDQLINASIDYSWVYENLNIFGETAISDNGAIATTNGLLIGLDRKIDLSVAHRFFPRDYQALNPNPFAETNGARNENGIYFGLEIRPSNQWKVQTYFDMYNHPWLRFGVDAPSRGYDFRSRITYFKKRKINAYVEFRYETKQQNAPGNTTKSDILVFRKLFQTRFHFGHKVNSSLELRTRLDVGFANNGVSANENGMMIYQDVLYKPTGFPISFTTRFAIFNTDSFNIRFFHFENDLLYTFSVPAYFHKGTRFYFNLRYKGIRNLTLEARFAQTYLTNQDAISSGLNEIEGSRRTELKAQIKYQF